MITNSLRILLFLSIAMLMQSCSHKMTPGIVAKDIKQYKNAYVSTVHISSQKRNTTTIKSNKKIVEHAEKRLEKMFKDNSYGKKSLNKKTLKFEIYIELAYGNRGMRYLIGFGAGKAKLTSRFIVKDPRTGATKYSATGTGSMSGGFAGGNVESYTKKHIDIHIKNYVKIIKD